MSNDKAMLVVLILFIGIDLVIRVIDMRTERDVEKAFLDGARQTSELWVSLINAGIKLGHMTFPRGPEYAVSHIREELRKRQEKDAK